jgi:sulfite exporter TauE/SafE
MNLIPIFLTGLLTGGLTCLAVQGGLLATTIAQREQDKLKEGTQKTGNALPILSFLIAKLIAYTLLGTLLGLLGSVAQLSLTAKITTQAFVAIFMIGTALNLLNVHPIFRYFIIQPPKFLTRLVRKESKSKNIFAPAILGAFTIFVPCGTTQAMMALAIASGNPLNGAATLFAFVLGTSPVFFILGYFATKLGNVFQKNFTKVAAYSLILLALFNLNGAIALTGSTFTLKNLWTNFYCLFSFCDNQPTDVLSAVVNNATITITDSGYAPNNLTVKAGSKVTLNLVNKSGTGCTQAFTLPKYNIQKIVPLGKSDTVSFTAPNQPGTKLTFMCSMGMYEGEIDVI